MTRTIQTARGACTPQELGPTLPHEHLFCNLLQEHRAEGLLNDERLIIEELARFVAQGGRTVVDLTTAELTRGASPTASSDRWSDEGSRQPGNVEAIRRVSEVTGLNVVLGTGHYRDPYLDRQWFDRHDVDAIAERMIADIEVGFPGTDVRAGIIGEIGCDAWFTSAAEERSFRAAARAHLATGVAIHTHAAHWPVGGLQLDLLESEGVDPSRVAVGHCDLVRVPGYALEIAERGAFVGIDTIFVQRESELAWRLSLITELVEAGFADRVLLSHDVCLTGDLHANGGGGFGFVHGAFRDLLAESVPGFDDELFRRFTVDNPRRLLAQE
ncbi:hypothetical protein AADR41_01965 [Streptomyces sp. CLV115]|uniref:phosphotriesterase family protein n=1 Tax=Streptomyces sp. CLV115 TaxID=3138502 RepID=UPI00313F2D28